MRYNKIYQAIGLLYLLLCGIAGIAQQKRQLSPDPKNQRIAYIDHSLLRKQFPAIKAVIDKQKLEWKTAGTDYDKALKDLEKDTQKQLKSDSLTGSLKKKEIEETALSKKDTITKAHQKKSKAILKARGEQLEQLEKKIQLAIGEILKEKGYTEAKPTTKDAKDTGTDITALVLQKLN